MGKGTCSLVCSTSISPLLCSCSTHRARVQFQLRGKSFFLLMSFWRKKSLVVKKRCLRQSLPVQNTNWEDVCRLFTFYNRSENNILPEKHIKTLLDQCHIHQLWPWLPTVLSARTPSRMSGCTAWKATKAKRFPPSSTKAASGVWSVGTSWSPSATPHQKDTTTAKGTTTDSTAQGAEGATDPLTSQKKLPGMFVFHFFK